MKKLFSILSFLTIICVWGQNETPDFLPQITPPSPDAAALGNYGNIPVGEFTGAANINIPLITYKTKNLEMPISLYYGSNGIKVDEFGSKVGLGWNINMGGIITRTVRDLDDFKYNTVYAPDVMTGGYSNFAAMDYFQLGSYENIDTEADFYSFNVGGYSGEFMFGKNGIVFTNPQKVRILQYESPSHEIYFKLITPDGITYFFEEIEQNRFRTFGAGHQPPTIPSVTAWYLTKIIHPKGDEIYLTYQGDNKTYVNSESQTLSYSDPFIQSTCEYDPMSDHYYVIPYIKSPTLSPIISNLIHIIGKKIDRIYSNSHVNGEILINYTYNNENASTTINTIALVDGNNEKEKITFDYLETQNNRFFLNSIQFKDNEKKYAFTYYSPEDFPERLYRGQDHWGFYNGVANNQNIVPKNLPEAYTISNAEYGGADKEPNGEFAKIGMLKKIIYPTKGYTEFEYEPNTYWGPVSYPGEETSVPLSVNTEFTNSEIDSEIIESLQNQLVTIYGSASYIYYSENCTENLGPNKHKIVLDVKNLATNDEVPLFVFDAFGQHNYNIPDEFNEVTIFNPVYFEAEADVEYEIKITAHRECTEGAITAHLFAGEEEIVDENIVTGGVRIKSTNDVSLITNDAIYKRFYYSSLDSLEESSGVLGAYPNYIDISKIRVNCGGPTMDIFDRVVSSSSLISLYDSGNGNIFYPYVTISEGGDDFENGGIAKEFILNRDMMGNSYTLYDIKSAPWTNYGWNNGFVKNVKVLKQNPGGLPIKVQETENIYTNDERDNFENKSYAIRKDFALSSYGDVTLECTSENSQNQYSFCHNVCTTEHAHSWFIGADTYCIASGHHNQQFCYPNPCFQNEGSTITRPQFIENLSIMEYKTISHWNYLSETKTTTYDTNGTNPIMTETKYFYDNPDHLQLTTQTLTNSDGKTHTTSYRYPPDLIGEEQSPYMQDLTDANRISEPVITETFVEEGVHKDKTSETHLKYGNSSDTGNLLLPVEAHIRKGTGNIDINTIEDRKVTYTKYGTNGNILEYKLENGTYVSIIWGYNKQYPIARVEGEMYDNLSTYITTLQNASDNGTLTVSSFDSLRNGLPGALVTGYVYEPLVGVKVITHPNRTTEYYDYDAFGRLKEVKNSQGEVIRKMEYNYKPQP